jgi:hypothetical protein
VSNWDQACVDTLRGLSLLRCLQLSPYFKPSHGHAADSLPQASVTAALAQLTPLTSLTLKTIYMDASPLQCMSALSQLSHLSLVMAFPETPLLTDLLVALGAHQLTRLCIATTPDMWNAAVLTDQACHNLTLMAGCLQELSVHVIFKSAHSLCSTLAALTRLTRLTVELPDSDWAAREPWWDPSAMSIPKAEKAWAGAMAPLAAPKRLSALHIVGEGADAISAACLGRVSCFSQLRELSVYGDDWRKGDDARWGRAVTGADLWQLLPLQSTLTYLHLGQFRSVDGPGLAVIGKLTCLRTLKLSHIKMIDATLPKYLLPLPPKLCNIHLRQAELCTLPELSDALQMSPGGLPTCAVHTAP